MNRYHKNIYFKHNIELKRFNDKLNTLNWTFSKHAIDNLKYRAVDNITILQHIKALSLNYENIFEYYAIDDNIEKICYRIPYNHSDIIIVLSKNKTIITIYLNSKNDSHATLKTEVYTTI